MNISEKSAYLKGLLEGMDYDTTSNEGKLFAAIIDLLGEISETVLELDDENAMVNEFLDELDEDLGNVEDIVYNNDGCDCNCGCDCDEDDYEYDDDFDDDLDDEDDDEDEDDDDDDDEDEDDDDDLIGFKAVECAHCGEDVYIDSEFTDKALVCPHCFETIKLDK